MTDGENDSLIALKRALDGVSGQLTKIEQRLDQVDARSPKIEQRLDQLDARSLKMHQEMYTVPEGSPSDERPLMQQIHEATRTINRLRWAIRGMSILARFLVWTAMATATIGGAYIMARDGIKEWWNK